MKKRDIENMIKKHREYCKIAEKCEIVGLDKSLFHVDDARLVSEACKTEMYYNKIEAMFEYKWQFSTYYKGYKFVSYHRNKKGDI